VRRSDSEFEARPHSPSVVEAVWRSLDTSEALFANYNAVGAFLTAQVLEVHGPVTEALLRQAFAHLEERHRLLAHASSPAATRCAGPKGLQFLPESPSSTVLLRAVSRR